MNKDNRSDLEMQLDGDLVEFLESEESEESRVAEVPINVYLGFPKNDDQFYSFAGVREEAIKQFQALWIERKLDARGIMPYTVYESYMNSEGSRLRPGLLTHNRSTLLEVINFLKLGMSVCADAKRKSTSIDIQIYGKSMHK